MAEFGGWAARNVSTAALELRSAEWLKEFRLERSLPVWTYSINGITLEKRVVMPHRQNTVQISYRILEPDADVRLELRPSLQFRPHEGALGRPLNEPHVTYVVSDRFEFASPVQHIPRLKMKLYARGSAFTFEQQFIQEVLYRIEEARGYESRGDLWSPGYFACDLRGTEWATVTGSIEPWETIEALDPRTAHGIETQRFEHLLTIAEESAREEMGAELVLAADQFIITPVGRVEEMARARARGDEVRTVIAGYHWFTDWGRDTMISLEGLTLVTGRHTRSRLDSAHLRPLHPRRPHSQHVPRRENGKACITRRTPRCGSFTPSTATSTQPATA